MLNPPPDIAELWRPGSNPCRSRWPYVTCTEDMQAVETM